MLLFLTLVAEYSATLYSVLVAGSTGIENYRHQADLCHSYHLLVDCMAVDPSQVTVMMYDDVAWSPMNPLIGRLFNEPDGDNVYEGCLVNHRKAKVTVDNFLAVLNNLAGLGNATKNLFVSFVDHGQPRSLMFPNGEQLSGNRLVESLHTISSRFANILVYVEACFAGSVFEDHKLPSNTLAVTAANATESSWGTFCPTSQHPDADAVNGIHIGTCLGDLFELAWIKDIEARIEEGSIRKSTLEDHITRVRETVNRKSHVVVYGNEDMLNMNISDFFPFRNQTVTPKNGKKIDAELMIESSRMSKCDWVTGIYEAPDKCDTSTVVA